MVMNVNKETEIEVAFVRDSRKNKNNMMVLETLNVVWKYGSGKWCLPH